MNATFILEFFPSDVKKERELIEQDLVELVAVCSDENNKEKKTPYVKEVNSFAQCDCDCVC